MAGAELRIVLSRCDTGALATRGRTEVRARSPSAPPSGGYRGRAQDPPGPGAAPSIHYCSNRGSPSRRMGAPSTSQEARFPSKFITEELKKVFTEEAESETEEFEGFNSDVEFLECHVGNEVCKDQAFSSCEEEETTITPKRRSFGLRVAFQFPSKTSMNNPSIRKKSRPSNSELPMQGNKRRKPLVSVKSTKTMKNRTGDSASESENECDKEKENSSALMKRAMNIKENKAMLAQLLAELKSMPELFPVKTPTSTPSKPKKTPRLSFTEGEIERRTNPTRNARPPENFALENVTASAVQFAEHLQKYRQTSLLKRTLSEEDREEHRRRRSSSKYTSFRSVEDITEDDLENVAITVKDKIYDKVLGSTCHQCRQKTIDTKTVCRNGGCGGVRGQFCGPCLRNRYGEDVRSALIDPDWICPSCRGICNCSYCRKRDGRCATGMLIHLAKFSGYDNVQEYLESLQKQLIKN